MLKMTKFSWLNEAFLISTGVNPQKSYLNYVATPYGLAQENKLYSKAESITTKNPFPLLAGQSLQIPLSPDENNQSKTSR